MFTPDDQRGGGEGGGRKVIVIEVVGIPVPDFEPHRGSGGPWVLLLAKNPSHSCGNVNPKGCLSDKSVIAIARLLIESEEKIIKAFKKASETGTRQAIKTGGEDYIKSLADLVEIIICEKFVVNVIKSE